MGLTDIKALVLDVDGVLTDGRLYYDASGEALKVFYVQDGTAIRTWREQGRYIAFLSGRDSPIVRRRAADLGVESVIQGVSDKLTPFKQLLESWSIQPRQTCYVGDDTLDLPPMQACGFPVAVANAVPEVKQCAKFVTRTEGGRGAVREVISYLLEHEVDR